MTFSYFMHVDKRVKQWSDFFLIFVNPFQSYSAFLWYIYVLFLFFLVLPPLYRLSRGRIYLMLPFALALYFVDAPTWFCLNQFCEYIFIFILGCWAGDQYTRYTELLDRFRFPAIVIFAAALALALPWNISKLVMGLLSIPALHSLMRMRMWEPLSNELVKWGWYTFAIYLMNTMFIGFIKGLFLQFLKWNTEGFLIMAPFMIIGGVYGTILAKKILFSRVRWLDRITS